MLSEVCWRHRSGPVDPPLRLSQISYDEGGAMIYPCYNDRADESELKRYLDEARALVLAREGDASHAADAEAVGIISTEFDNLRWFDLPLVCVDQGTA